MPALFCAAVARVTAVHQSTGFTGMKSQDIEEAAQALRTRVQYAPQVGLILGSGLGDFADSLTSLASIPTSEIPHYPAGSVQGHRGRLVFSEIRPGTVALTFQGRLHFYESGHPETVLFPIRIAHALGVRTLLLTNAAGGVNRTFHPGDLMLISDQINLTMERASQDASPRETAHLPRYDPQLSDLAMREAAALGIPLHRGVYAGVKGPSYETAAEVEMIHRMGGDAVGMSTVLEVELAASLGMRTLGISCITNKATGIGTEPLSHDEVTEVAARVKTRFLMLISALLSHLSV